MLSAGIRNRCVRVNSSERDVRSAMCVEWNRHKAKFPTLRQLRYFFPSTKRKGSPIMHQRRGSPISRHAPCISPSASKPQIGLRRAPASGPSILRIGSRASPRLHICVVNHESIITVTRGNNNNRWKDEREQALPTQWRIPRHLRRVCSHPRTLGLSQ